MNRKPHLRRRARRLWAAPARRPPLDLVTRLVYYATHLISLLTLAGWVTGTALALFSTAAYAGKAGVLLAAPASIEQVVNNIRAWLVGILVAVATLFLTIGGLRLMWANGDPGEAEKGKAALKSAAVGYGLAMLAPLIVTIVGKWVA
jgi:Type IV secretion system pilin